jgi:anti-repressor protein
VGVSLCGAITKMQLDIIRTTLDSEEVNAVNARDLHAELGVGRDFSNWFKARVRKYEFVEGEDYEALQPAPLSLATFGEQSGTGSENKMEYIISLNMAKELAMLENNEKGRAARRYFIAAEKANRAIPTPMRQMKLTPKERRELGAVENKYIEKAGFSILSDTDWGALMRVVYDIAQSTSDPRRNLEVVQHHLYAFSPDYHATYAESLRFLAKVREAFDHGYVPAYDNKGLIPLD